MSAGDLVLSNLRPWAPAMWNQALANDSAFTQNKSGLHLVKGCRHVFAGGAAHIEAVGLGQQHKGLVIGHDGGVLHVSFAHHPGVQTVPSPK